MTAEHDHGTTARYVHGDCRCAHCRRAARLYQIAYRKRRDSGDSYPHGTITGFNLGCNCEACRCAICRCAECEETQDRFGIYVNHTVADVIRSKDGDEVRDYYILRFIRCESCSERRARLGDILCRRCISEMTSTQAA